MGYRGAEETPQVAPLPARRNGNVTFGSFNNFAKLSPGSIAVWARMLREVPDARLILKCPQFKDEDTRGRAIQAFAAAGIGSERLDLCPPFAAAADHLAHYGDIDIALDPLPYNGTATTCEALWMGVPVITLRGNRHAARVGASILTTLGLERLVAANAAEYVAIAASLASDLDALAALRASLRPRIALFAALRRTGLRPRHGGRLSAPKAAEALAKRLLDNKSLNDFCSRTSRSVCSLSASPGGSASTAPLRAACRRR